MQEVLDVMKAVGLPPEMAGTALVLAVLLRYLRGMVASVTSEWSYVAAVALGAVGGWLGSDGDPKAFLRAFLAFTATTLILQRALQSLAKVLPWLPQDNEWVK